MKRACEIAVQIHVICLIFLALPAGAATKFLDFPDQPVSEYAIHKIEGGLAVAVEAIREKKTLKAYFDADMVAKGFLPVHVVLENVSTETLFLFLTDDLAYVIGVADVSGIEERDSTLGQFGIATKIFSNPAAVLISPVGFMLGGISINKSMSFRHNLSKKELRSQSIAPGESIEGFVLIPIVKKDRNVEVAMRIRVSQIATQRISDYEFVL